MSLVSRKSLRRSWPSVFLLFFLFETSGFCEIEPSIAAPGEVIDNETCMMCHDDPSSDAAIDFQKYASSVHGQNLCISCHSDIKEIPHQDKIAKVSCADCHELETRIYQDSDHGKAAHLGMPAAGCLDCHGNPHTVVITRDSASPVYRLNIAKTCATCHSDTEKMADYSLLEKEPVKSYMDTVHGQAFQKGSTETAVCTDCHGSHDLSAPTNPKSKIYRMNVPATCGKCHENIFKSYQISIHGRAALSGKIEAPICTDCHGEHKIISHFDPRSSVYVTVVSEKTCGHCHDAEKIASKYRLPSDRLTTYQDSYHGMASKFGVTTVANCSSCHGAHDILPSSDPRSSVHKTNLPHTCGKCHPNVGEQLAKGSVHLSRGPDRDRIVYFVTLFYYGLIILVIGGMLCHNTLDFIKKFREIYRHRRAEPGALRFTPNERIQHFVLFVSFSVLAYSGFALKFSETWWAAPLTAYETGFDLRGLVHRCAAVVFTGLTLYHVCYLIFTRRGREQIKAFLPRKKDFSHFIAMQRYNLGLSDKRPAMGGYGYVEKAEYWALVWGSIIMILTGAFMTFENFAMRYAPKWFMDVANTIHYYEAVLATLAIIVWHFYFTIFDPEHYPMHMSMLTGKDSPPESGQIPPEKKIISGSPDGTRKKVT